MLLRKEQIDALAQAHRLNRRVNLVQQLIGAGGKARVDPKTGQVVLEDSRGKRSLVDVNDQGIAGLKTAEGRQYHIDRDQDGHVTGLFAPGDSRCRISYDNQGAPTELFLNEQRILHLDYSTEQSAIRATFADDARELLEYDPSGNLVRTVDAAGNETQLRRDESMRVIELRDPRGHSTFFDYDEQGVPLGVTFPDGSEETYEADEAGRIEIAMDGQPHAFLSFNAADDLELVEFSDGHHVRFGQKDGKITDAGNQRHKTKLEYGDNDLLKKEVQDSSSVEYEYDGEGNVVRLRTPDGQTLRYAHDGDDLIREILDWDGRSYRFEHDPSGQISGIVFPNGVVTRIGLSPLGQDVSITTTSPALPNEPIVSDRYAYDSRGRVVERKRGDAEKRYRYDAAGRLVEAIDSRGANEGFDYDPSGNRISCGERKASFDEMNRLLRDDEAEFQYDAFGNMVGRTGRQSAQYAYNGQGHLIQATTLEGGAVRYSYDAFGRRVTKQIGEVVTRFVWAGRQLLQEITTERGRAIERRDYLYLPAEHFPVAVRINGQTYCYHTDRLGTVLAMTDMAGQVVWKADYSAFGEARIVTERVRQPLRFLGQYHDAETGLHYNLFRYYDPKLGRYLTPDPIRYEAGSSNFYVFANNDPVNQSDPEGQIAFLAALGAIAVGAVVGGLIGGAISAATGGNFWDGAKAGAIGGAIAVAAPIIGAALGLSGLALGAVALAGSAIAGGVESCVEQGASVGTFLKGAGIALAATVLTAGLARIPGVRKLVTSLGKKIGGRLKKLIPSRVHKAAKKLMSKLGIGPKMRNRVHRKTCKSVGHPVDVATGQLFTELVDFELDGPLSLRWERVWYSASEYAGSLGHGWHHGYDLGLIVQQEGVAIRLADGRGLAFTPINVGQDVFNELEGLRLSRDDQGYLLSDAGGKMYRFAAVGRGEEHSLISVEDDGGARIRFVYDSQGWLTEIIDSADDRLQVVRNQQDRITEIRRPRPEDPTETYTVVRYEYNDRGDLIAAYDILGQPFRYEYQDHLLVKETDRRGYSFLFHYDGSDANARCIETRGQDGLYTVHLKYEPRATIVEHDDGGVWTYKHNGKGIVTELIDPYGGVKQFKLDGLGRVVKEVDPNGNATTLEYDGNGEHIRRVNCVGHPSPPEHVDPNPPDPNAYELPETPLEWEQGEVLAAATGDGPDHEILSQVPAAVRAAALRIHSQSGVGGEPTEHFDLKGRLIERRYPDGAREAWTYDAEDNLLTYKDRDGVTIRQTYESRNLLVGETDALGQTAQYEYSHSEELIRLVDSGGTEHRFDYDLKDRNTAISINGRLLDSYAYDAADNLIERRDGQGRTLVRYEMGCGNVDAKRILADGERHRFEYDNQGRLTVAGSPAGVTKLAYTEDGVQVKDQRDGLGVEHELDENGTLRQTTCLGHAVVYAHDPDDPNVLVVTDPTGGKHRFHIGQDGGVLKKLSNGTEELVLYDKEGHCLSKQAWRAESRGAPLQRHYRYSPAGDLAEIEDSARGATRYEYDAAHRLQREINSQGKSTEYAFDHANNLIRQPGLSNVLIGDANQLSQANGDIFTYNERGHIARRSGRCGDIRYHYNSLDLLTRIEINGNVWEAAYDPLCRRVSKTWRGQTTRYWWDDFRLAAEQRPDGAFRLYIYPDHKSLVPFMFVEYPNLEAGPETGRAYFIFTNQIGAPLRVEDVQGRTVWAAEIDPFGRARVTVNLGIDMSLRFPGHYFDAETGLHYNRFRYYSPELGKYLQVDPLGIGGDINLYGYSSNPLVEVDIDGNEKRCKGKPKPGKAGGKRKTGPKKPCDALYERGSFRKSAIQKAKKEAPRNKSGKIICPTCGKIIPDTIAMKTRKGLVRRRGFDLDHYPKIWAKREARLKARKTPPSRAEVIDEYNRDLRVQCPPCNQGHKWEGIKGPFQK